MRQSSRDRMNAKDLKAEIAELEAREDRSAKDEQHLGFLREILRDVETRRLLIDLDDRFVPASHHRCVHEHFRSR